MRLPFGLTDVSIRELCKSRMASRDVNRAALDCVRRIEASVEERTKEIPIIK